MFGDQLWPILFGISLAGNVLLLCRPLLKKLTTPDAIPTNADRVLGELAKVTETIDTLRVHADQECDYLKREEAEVVETGGALAQAAALTYLHHNHEVLRKQAAPRVRYVGTCPCLHRED